MTHRWAELLLWLLLLWTLTGVIGVSIARRHGDRQRATTGLRSLLTVWAIYLALLVALSLRQPTTVLQPGQPRCFGEMCFSVLRAEELQGFWVRGQQPDRLVRVGLQVANRGSGRVSEPELRAVLFDDRGRRWTEVPGLSGVRLGAPLPAHASTLSEPVFRLPGDAKGLRLALVHPPLTLSRLVLGDPESLWHRPSLLLLPPSATTH